jgi:DNA-binding LacI/PurR family transcriptional regulator
MQIMEKLKEEIESGRYASDQKLPTEQELSKKFNVSSITSKRALSELERAGLIYRIRGSGSYVKPNPAPPDAIGAEREQNMVALILPAEDMGSAFLHCMLGAAEYLQARGYYLSVHASKVDEERKRFLTELPNKGFKGIIYYPIGGPNHLELLAGLHYNHFPLVIINRYFEGFPFTFVVSDNYHGALDVTRHLIRLGHSKIAFVSGADIERTSSDRERYLGYCDGLREAGIPLRSDLAVNDAMKGKSGYPDEMQYYTDLVQELLGKGVTAIVGGNDLLALNLIKSATKIGVRIPDELSITGFDNREELLHLDIPVTTVAQNFHEIGRIAAEKIVRSIEQKQNGSEKIIVPTALIERRSSGAAPGANADRVPVDR